LQAARLKREMPTVTQQTSALACNEPARLTRRQTAAG
jgi:hypothetical protein